MRIMLEAGASVNITFNMRSLTRTSEDGGLLRCELEPKGAGYENCSARVVQEAGIFNPPYGYIGETLDIFH